VKIDIDAALERAREEVRLNVEDQTPDFS